MRPRDARKNDDICRLRRDNKSVPSGWILLDGDSVVLANQVPGEMASGTVEFTRSEFHRLIDWYNRPQKVRDQ